MLQHLLAGQASAQRFKTWQRLPGRGLCAVANWDGTHRLPSQRQSFKLLLPTCALLCTVSTAR